jgi:hypothetical protein
MKLKFVSLWSGVALLVAASACSKSNPTRPTNVESAPDTASVTDAVSGITLTTPQLSSPNEGASFKFVEQPVSLVVKNAVTTGSTALTYTFEVATDVAFASKAFTKEGVAQGSGNTSLTLDKLAADKNYFWRARASSGSVAGPFTKARSFKVGPEVILQAPVLGDPPTNSTVDEQPTLNVNRVSRTGPADQIFYRFELSDTSGFGSVVYSVTVPERSDLPYTPHRVTRVLDETTYFWRVQATDPANAVNSPFSSVAQFKVAKGIDLRTVHIVLGPRNIADWERTATISDAYWIPDQLCIFHNRLGIWPGVPFFGDAGTLVEGNQWVFAFINGQWHGGAADWYRPAQACKGVGANSIGRDAFYNPSQEPLHSWVPQSGELFGVMSTTPARFWPDMRTYDERTDVKVIRWP